VIVPKEGPVLETCVIVGSRRLCPYAAVVTGPVFEFSEVFDEDYLYFYGPHLDAVSDAQTETVWHQLELEPGMEVLDLACGHGRIANRLAQRGAHVTGLDATPLFLEHARRDAAERGVEVDYVCGDMRSLPWPVHRFERIISWFTSFGYFDDAENREVLQLILDRYRKSENQVRFRWKPGSIAFWDNRAAVHRAVQDYGDFPRQLERVLIDDEPLWRNL